MDGAFELLTLMKAAGVSVVIVTNNNVLEQELKLRLLGLAGLVDALVTSEEVGCSKPDSGIFHAALKRFDTYLASKKTLHKPAERMFQGAIADSLTHTGQITMLRRLAGSHVRGENYSRADIRMGRVGADQSPPPERSEFD